MPEACEETLEGARLLVQVVHALAIGGWMTPTHGGSSDPGGPRAARLPWEYMQPWESAGLLHAGVAAPVARLVASRTSPAADAERAMGVWAAPPPSIALGCEGAPSAGLEHPLAALEHDPGLLDPEPGLLPPLLDPERGRALWGVRLLASTDHSPLAS